MARWFRRQGWLNSLRVRLAAPFIILSTVVLLVLGYVLVQGIERGYEDHLRNELESTVRLSGLYLENSTAGDELRSRVDAAAERSDTRITVIDADGSVLADSETDPATMDNHNDRPEVREARAGGIGESRRPSETVGEPFIYVAVASPDGSGDVIRAAVTSSEVSDTVGVIARLVVLAILLLLGGLVAVSWFVAGRIAGPLDSLRLQANRVAQGDFTTRIATSELAEVNEVGSAFNLMTRALERSMTAQEQTGLRLAAVMEGLADAVLLTDDEGVIVRINRAAEEMLGVDEAEVVGLPFVQGVRDHELAEVLWRVLDGRPEAQATVSLGLDQRVVLTTARMIDGPHERLGLVVLRDITELRRLETVRREFVANVSHELRTPLTSIRILVETLESGAVDEPAMAQEFLGRIIGEVDRLNLLVEDLLELARLEAGRTPLALAKHPIADVIRDGAERLRPQVEYAGLALRFEIEEDLPIVQVDLKRVEQVLVNLIHNAIKYTPQGGSITIAVYRDGKRIHIAVRDTGIGIPAEDLPRLFERFYKSDRARRSEGTGLGLAIAKHIVLLHGGDIWAESTQGEGSTFHFTIPVRGKKARKRARRHIAGLV